MDEQGDIVGFANGGPEREKDALYTAELYALYLLPERQRGGYGKALLRATAEWRSLPSDKAHLQNISTSVPSA